MNATPARNIRGSDPDEFSPPSRTRRRLKIRRAPPPYANGIVLGFWFRVVVGVLSVALSTFVMMIMGYFNGWVFSNTLLYISGTLIAAMVLIGEHLRVRTYEFVSSEGASKREIEVDAIYVDDYAVDVRNYGDYISGNRRLAQNDIKSEETKWSKRFFDILIAIFFLFFFAPLFILIAALIKFDSRGPILARWFCIGQHGRPFWGYRFRTRTVMSHQPVSGPEIRSHPFTRVGRALRSANLDTLPLLFNVLLNDMSVVGPWPYGYEWRWESQGDWESQGGVGQISKRHRFKPGMMGWAQVNGYSRDTMIMEDLDAATQLDLYYIENWSMWLDLKIFARSLLGTVVSRWLFGDP